MARLTAGESAIAIGMVQLGASYAHFARILNCTKLTITRLIQRYRKRKIPHHNSQRGQPHEDRHLRILHLRNTFLTVTSSAAPGLGHVVSRHTVRRRLRQHGIGAYRPFRGVTLMRQNRIWCLRWARQFPRWQHRKWQRVLFIPDENRFQLFRADGRTRIYRRANISTCRRENSSVLCSGDRTVWWWICDGFGRFLWTDVIVID